MDSETKKRNLHAVLAFLAAKATQLPVSPSPSPKMSRMKLHELCKNWWLLHLNFSTIVELGLDILGILPENFAEAFQVSSVTVRRWANGTASPHPKMQDEVVYFIADLLGMEEECNDVEFVG